MKNEAQLNQTRRAISKLEAGLEALRRDVLPCNPARFAMMAEPVKDQIRELRNEISKANEIPAQNEDRTEAHALQRAATARDA